MNKKRVKKNFFIVEDPNSQCKFRVKYVEKNFPNGWSYELKVIEGQSFISEDYLKILLMEISYTYSGIGKMIEPVGGKDIIFHFDIDA